LRERIDTYRPDVVHIHNVYPLIGPGAVLISHSCGIPVVQTVHNYRHSCVNGLHYRSGAACFDCGGLKKNLPAIWHGCYQQSRARSVPMAISLTIHRRTWSRVSAFLTLSSYMRQRLVASGLPGKRIYLRATATDDPGAPTRPARGAPLLYIGRLDTSKGVELLSAAMSRAGQARSLWVIGDGPDRKVLSDAAASGAPIEMLGRLRPEAVSRYLSKCSAVVVPSLCAEGYPKVVAEAFAHGRPVVTVRGGSVESIVDENVGWVSRPDPGALAELLQSLTDGEVLKRGKAARGRFLQECTREVAFQQLMTVYEAVRSSPVKPGEGNERCPR
jgi:glycosyltransferase involved in cell wall biosynthesis